MRNRQLFVEGLMPEESRKLNSIYRTIMNILKKLIDATSKEYKLKVFLNTEATAEIIKKQGFDTVIYAAGTKDVELKLPGYEKANKYWQLMCWRNLNS
jgi:hypothetical protein